MTGNKEYYSIDQAAFSPNQQKSFCDFLFICLFVLLCFRSKLYLEDKFVKNTKKKIVIIIELHVS